jgi:hypothetical protein
MGSFKQYFNQKKFEEEIEVDVEDASGAVYKIPLGSEYEGGIIKRSELKNSYIVVNITDENEDGELIDEELRGIFKYYFELFLDKDSEPTMEIQNIFEPNEVIYIFKELKNTILMFKKHIEEEGQDFNGFSFEILEKGNIREKRKRVYEKMFSVIPGKLEETETGKFIYRFEED